MSKPGKPVETRKGASHPAKVAPDHLVPRSRETQLIARATFSGPMPPPALVREYEDIYPGAAKFFFNTLDKQSDHRRGLERTVVNANVLSERVGMILAFILAALLIVSGTFLIYHDKDPQGLSLIAGTLVTLCGVFIYGRSRASRELQEKDPAAEE